MTQRFTLGVLSVLLGVALLLTGLPTTRVSADTTKTPVVKVTKAAKCDDAEVTAIAARLAQVLNAPSQDIMKWHCEKHQGFGEIKMAYLLAKIAKNPMTVEQIFAFRTQHKGWGQIFKLAGVKPQDFYRSLAKTDRSLKAASDKEKAETAAKANTDKAGKDQANKDKKGGKGNSDKLVATATVTPTSTP